MPAHSLLRRHDLRDTSHAHWRPAHLRWLSELVCPPPAQQLVLHEDIRAVTAQTDRWQRLEAERHTPAKAWRLSPVGEALQARRGVQVTVAGIPVAERSDLRRFNTPRARRQVLGLVPSAHARGERRRQGALPKAGKTHARRVLVEGAWADRYPAQGSRHRHLRLENPSNAIPDISWKAHGRLWKRYRPLLARGKHAHHVVGAMARALVGGMGAMAPEVSVMP